MRIQNNIMALNTHRQYTINNDAISKSAEKLSSGYRINRAGDDAAGLAISEKMRAQIRGLNMAAKNSQDAVSLVQTAEGALQESHNILQRMRELAVQSASDTNETTVDRDALNKEFQQLIKELDDTAAKTTFNEMGVIDGTFSSNIISNSFTSTVAGVVKSAWVSTDAIPAGLEQQIATITYSSVVVAASVAGVTVTTSLSTNATDIPTLSVDGATVGTVSVTTGTAMNSEANGVWQLGYDPTQGLFTARNMSTGETRTAAAEAVASGSAYEISFGDIGSITFAAGTGDANPDKIRNLTGTLIVTGGVTKQDEVTDDYLTLNGEAVKIEQGQNSVAFANSGVSIELQNSYVKNTDLGSITITATRSTNQEFVVQTGANQGDTLAISIDKMDAYTLGVKNATVANRLDASTAITQVTKAINSVSTQRASLGALQNRLEHKIANLKTSSENLSAAESRIRDVDMASEMTTFTKNNILAQAATAMLAQANSAPQNVLSLLR